VQTHAPTSALLARLVDEAPKDFVTLEWLIGHLQRRSFGPVMLILAIICAVPGIGMVAGLLLAFPAIEMMVGRENVSLPHVLALRPIPAPLFIRWTLRAIPLLKFVEGVSRPRWHMPLQATKRTVGLIVLLLAVASLWPIPLANVVPALFVALISLAFLEEDGALLCISLAGSRAGIALLRSSHLGVDEDGGSAGQMDNRARRLTITAKSNCVLPRRRASEARAIRVKRASDRWQRSRCGRDRNWRIRTSGCRTRIDRARPAQATSGRRISDSSDVRWHQVARATRNRFRASFGTG
jgi:hypothetical protein